nr:unnamed protein product [Spirometra erinaceieuropaei]
MEEVYDRIMLAIKILQSFKKQFEIYRKKLPDFFGKLENPQEPVYWEFSGTLVFGKVDKYLERLDSIKRLLEEAMEFEKLDRVVIGGLLGEGLSAKNRPLECIRIGETSSPPHSRSSHSSVSPPPGEAHEEVSIHEDSATSNDPQPAVASGAAAAATAADDDTTSSKHSETGVQPEPVTASSSFETSVETPSKYRPPPSLVDKNMPSVAGELKWSAELQKRLSLVPYLLDHIHHPLMQSKDADRVRTRASALLEKLKKWDEDVFQAWRMSVDADCEENLLRPLLISDPKTGLFRVNFDPKLQAILREMKYLQFKDRAELPESACRLFSQKDILRNYVLNLDLLTQWYNYLHTKVSDQEADLISSEMKDIERKLMEAQSDLNWTNEDTWQYIESTRDVIKDLKARVVQCQENVEKISALMSTWNKTPLFERKEGKRETLLALDDREERASKRYSEISEAGERIIAILEENRQLFRAELDSEAWQTYVEEIDTIVRDGFINAIRCSLNYLLDETEDIPTLAALFEVQMDLVDELEENEMLVELRQTFFDRINEAVQKALACQASFDSYAYLWADDRSKFMRHFLTYGEMPNTEDEEAAATAAAEGTTRAAGERQPSPPSLGQFKEQMDRFEAIYAEVEQMEGTMKFNNCLRVDARRFKHGVLNIVKRWSLMFKQHLIEHVTDSLKELAEFIQVTSKGLEDEVKPGDYEHLVSTMGFLGGMKERQAATDEMFEPLQQTIELLKTYQHQMPDEVHRQLEELPEKWAHLKKQAAIVKQVVAPLQNEEVANIRRRGAAFDVAQHKAKEAFIKIPPFDYSCEEPYKHLDEQHLVLRAMELDLAALVKSAELFEVSLPDFRQLKQCRRNLRLLKVLWDHVFVVRSRIASWTRTPWLEIDVDQLDADCRNFAKDLRRLDKEDGLFSVVMRDLANMVQSGPKWIVLDGDIDPMWIESLNTVMDDNKVLTLASNERIPLTPSMRLVFEISHLKTATPATVSRAGILYINPQDLGWMPFVSSWLTLRENRSEQANLLILFERYVPICLEALKSRFKKIIPIVEIAHVQMLCYLLDAHLTQTNTPADSPKELYELYFVFCAVWAFGGSLFQDQLVDHRMEFSKWWVSEFKSVKFPSQGSVFDYFIDPESKKFEPWLKRVEEFTLDQDIPLQSALVPTAETTRLRYFLDLLVAARRPVMLVGTAGTGKSVVVRSKLEEMGEDFIVVNVPFNFYTNSEMLQRSLEKHLEKKAGRTFGPPGTKRIIYFIDDLNMPEVDKYFTVQPHALMRQHIDHSHWYDRTKLILKDIVNTQYLACMNPTAGSFTVDPRLQRHFCVFSLSFPATEALRTIYSSILSQHLAASAFPPAVQKMANSITDLALEFHARMSTTFLPTAVKFHYIFNLRDLTNIFQGLLFSQPACLKTPTDIVRLWIHEAQRVYSDKMTEKADNETFQKLLQEVVKKNFYDMEEAALFRQPLLYCHFSQGIGEPLYMPVPDTASITKILTDALDNYNELNAAMNLVLFEDAIAHVLRINRILESPRGNALLVGIGGSGKQSLSRLAAFISSLEVFQITLRKGYGIADLKADLGLLYQKAGLKNVSTVFLITDAQIADEKFLVLVNDLLASGEVQDLFPDDEVENIISAMRGDVKASGLLDTRENCWSFFIDKVRRMLKVVLCFSPVGSTLRVRSRRFPALVNCTSIDWFHEWPVEALLSVSYRFISSVELLDPALYASVSKFMSFVHRSVNEVSQRYLLSERRYNYTTPKSFLEQIKLYESMLRKQHGSLESKMQRLENGLQKLESTSQQVDDLKAKLAAQEVELAEKNEDANKLLAIVGAETEKVSGEKANANAEEEKVAKIKIEVSRKQRECEQDLAKAEPALLAAQEALNTLNKNNLTEMKSFGSPPPAVVRVVSAVMCLLAPDGKVPKDRSWKAAKAGIMSRIDQFLDNLINYNKENIHENCLKAVSEYLGDPEFDPDLVRNKSLAAAGLCSWTINIVRFYEVYLVVKPKRDALDQANEELRLATEKLDAVRKKIADLEAKLQKLTDEFQAAADKKRKCQEEADTTFKTIELANRLVGGLVSENVRWSAQVEQFKNQAKDLPGNVLVTVAFLSYLGYFTKKYRNDLMYSHWMPYLTSLEPPIPISSDLDPLTLLVDDAVVASWNNEGLPNDRMSIENAAILTSAERWPLIVDPQLQSLKWVKTRYGDDLKTVRLGQKGYLDVIERTISVGGMLLFENIGEFIDPVLDPLLGRNTIKKGKAIRLGDKEIDYDPKFRLILHTKLANPHYKPEMQAQTTLINFTVTIDGLEDQLLANVVSKERPDLEKLKADLTHQQNEFKITLKALEDSLLARLSAAEGNFLGDYALVENLESNKRTAIEIEERVGKAKTTEGEINEARELYRPASERAALLYFILNDLSKINPIYQFSLKAFSIVFDTAMDRATPAEEVKERVANIIDSITYSVYIYVSRGLFEKDKLLFTSQMAFQILQAKKAIHPNELNFLLRFPVMPDVTSPVDFITNLGWGAIKALSALDEFKNLDSDIVGSAKRWKKLVESETPEKERLPQEWKNKSDLQALCIMRAIRPDRMLYALSDFVRKNLGSVFVEGSSLPFAHSFEESGPATPIFFILSPGVDPLKDVETLGKQLGFTIDNKKFHNISLGQGQETVAQAAMELAAKEGHWVVLQNIHLVAKWLPTLEKRLEEYGTTGHADYRVFISAEPASSPEYHIIPQGILENAIKITNEPPTGMQANLHKALKNFSQATLEMCSKENEFKTILFALCYFHAAICERRKFGPQGWNRSYPFNNGDLTISANVLYNYLEVNNIVPWEDLRYLFGEIMYGGHITDDWDRRLCKTYLEEYLAPEMLDGDHFLSPGFKTPTNTDMKGYHAYIDESLPAESPYLYGLHPNAEIEFLTMTSEKLFRTLLELMPKSAEQGEGAASSRDEKIQSILEDIWEKLPEPFNTASLQERVPPEERTPYVIVAFQECERMNILLREISRSLKELGLGLKGELTITAEMETISNSLYLDIVPPSWVILAYPSLLPLGLWYADLLARIKELDVWTSDFQLPAAVWLGGLFNPQSFLTAIMQQMARKNEWPLDRMVLQVDVTKKSKEELVSPPRDGAYVYNLFLEGARWDMQTGLLAEANMKELAPAMPVVFIKAIPVDRRDVKNMYECPVYKTKTRGPTFVWVFNLKTKERPAKWILRGVAILLQV